MRAVFEVMPSRQQAKALASRLHALSGGAQLQRKAAARELSRLDPLDATELIHHLIRLSREGWEPASCVLSYFVSALTLEAAHLPSAASLRRLASVQALEEVAQLFPDAAPVQELAEEAAARRDALSFSLPLGHLTQQARVTRNPDELSRLATASNPSVVRNVLLNPRLTEALVVRIAARRPARPEPLVEIWKSPRWSVRHAVRRALAFNPYLPPDIGAKILPLLSTSDLAELLEDASVHPLLREQARTLLQAAIR